jgi:hypothetical protein
MILLIFTPTGLTGTFLLIVYIIEWIPCIKRPDQAVLQAAIWLGDQGSYSLD